MTVIRRLLVSLALVAALASAAWAQAASVDAILREGPRFDNRPVLVSGTVTMVEGPQAFQLQDRGSLIRVVVSTGGITTPVTPGQRVEVEGIFKMGPRQIEAIRVSPR